MKKLAPFLIVVLIVLVIDALTKWWVASSLPLMNWHLSYPYGGVAVFKDFFGMSFSIVHETNKGAAWGSFAEYQTYLLWARAALIIILVVYLFVKQRDSTFIPLTLIVAGAIGNVIDFFFYGHVIDMIHLRFGSYSYPIFNLADSAIFIGVVWLALLTLFGKHAPKRKRH